MVVIDGISPIHRHAEGVSQVLFGGPAGQVGLKLAKRVAKLWPRYALSMNLDFSHLHHRT